jgi:hypothetical protein
MANNCWLETPLQSGIFQSWSLDIWSTLLPVFPPSFGFSKFNSNPTGQVNVLSSKSPRACNSVERVSNRSYLIMAQKGRQKLGMPIGKSRDADDLDTDFDQLGERLSFVDGNFGVLAPKKYSVSFRRSNIRAKSSIPRNGNRLRYVRDSVGHRNVARESCDEELSNHFSNFDGHVSQHQQYHFSTLDGPTSQQKQRQYYEYYYQPAEHFKPTRRPQGLLDMNTQSQRPAGMKRSVADFQDEISSFDTRRANRNFQMSNKPRNTPIDLTVDDKNRPSVSPEPNSSFRRQYRPPSSTGLIQQRWSGLLTKDGDERDSLWRREDNSTFVSSTRNLASNQPPGLDPNQTKPKLKQKLLKDAMSIDDGDATDCTTASFQKVQSPRTQQNLKPKKKTFPTLMLSNGAELAGLANVLPETNSSETMVSKDPSPGNGNEMSAETRCGSSQSHRSSSAISKQTPFFRDATSSASPEREASKGKNLKNSRETNSVDVGTVKTTVRQCNDEVTSHANKKPDEAIERAAVQMENSTRKSPILKKVRNATGGAEGKQIDKPGENLSKLGSPDETDRKQQSATGSDARPRGVELSRLPNTEPGAAVSRPPTARSTGPSSSNTKHLTEKQIKEITSGAAKERRRKEAEAKKASRHRTNGQITSKVISKSSVSNKGRKYGFKVREYDHLIVKLRERNEPFAKIAQIVSDKYPHLRKLTNRNANYRYKKAKAALAPDGSEPDGESGTHGLKASHEIPSARSSSSFPSLRVNRNPRPGPGGSVQTPVQHSRTYTAKNSDTRRSNSFEVQTFPRALPGMLYGVFTDLAV